MLKRFGLVFVLGLCGLAFIGWWSGWFQSKSDPVIDDPAPPDPRLTYKGPYKNVHPDVKYVGDKACAECHPIMTQGFHAHPMSQSLKPISDVLSQSQFQKQVSFKGLNNTWEMEIKGDKVFHVEKIFDQEKNLIEEFRMPVDFVVGSGRRGQSFFSRIGQALYQTPISWYGQKKIWDISPGFDISHLRRINSACLFCHSGGVHHVPNTLNIYEKDMFWNKPSINCERCHGPGELHVKARKANPTPDGNEDTIVNPRYLTLELREAICQQCHLEGVTRIDRRGRDRFEFRPGLPLSDFMTIFVHADRDTRGHAVSHVEQMYLSRCFIASKGTKKEMGCFSCHDVHDGADQQDSVTWYRNKCLDCHTEQSCHLEPKERLAKNAQDDCTACHMPRFQATDIVHTAATDHRILRKPLPKDKKSSHGSHEEHPYIPFQAKKLDLTDPEMRRDYAMALYRMPSSGGSQGADSERLQKLSIELLKEAVNEHPKDMDAIISLVGVYVKIGHTKPELQQEALILIDQILKQDPNHQPARAFATQLHMDRQEWPRALEHLKHLRKIEPAALSYARTMAVCYLKLQQWEQCLTVCREARELHPTDPLSNLMLVYTLRKLKKHSEATKIVRVLNAMNARNVERNRGMLDSFLRGQ